MKFTQHTTKRERSGGEIKIAVKMFFISLIKYIQGAQTFFSVVAVSDCSRLVMDASDFSKAFTTCAYNQLEGDEKVSKEKTRGEETVKLCVVRVFNLTLILRLYSGAKTTTK